MWRRVPVVRLQRRCYSSSPNIINIDNATFYRSYPAFPKTNRDADSVNRNPPLFSNLTFTLPADRIPKYAPEYWAILSPSSVARTTFLQILAGQHICLPPTARTYPYLSEVSKSPQHAIKYVGFDAERGTSVGGTNVRGAYLSARYESRREENDFSLLAYLTGDTELNALHRQRSEAERQALDEVVKKLDLAQLLHMPVANLSNGQTRRARIAKALMAQPEILLLDGPFMGLDPRTLTKMEALLHKIAVKQKPRLIMSLRPEDGIPDWISHILLADENLQVLNQGVAKQILYLTARRGPLSGTPAMASARQIIDSVKGFEGSGTVGMVSKDGWERESPALEPGEALVEMRGVRVAYGDQVVLGNWEQDAGSEQTPGLWWSLHRGQRCGIFGPNGSGKTTMLSLITSDHPQTYSLPIKLFGRSRLPGPGEAGISLFDIQRRMGHSSPEVHAFFPKQLTVRRALESAWADAPLAKPKLSAEADRRVDGFLRWFVRELNPRHTGKTSLETVIDSMPRLRSRNAWSSYKKIMALEVYHETIYDDSDLRWAEDVRFGELSFSSQRLLLFLRALVAQPDLVILDEALSGIDERVRDKALLFLSHGENVESIEEGVPVNSLLSGIGKTVFTGLSPDQALLVISHSKEDVPGCLREWICLPDPGEGRRPRTGTLPGPLELNPQGWEQIWGQEQASEK